MSFGYLDRPRRSAMQEILADLDRLFLLMADELEAELEPVSRFHTWSDGQWCTWFGTFALPVIKEPRMRVIA